MADLKLAKLPDRTSAKLTITISAGLNQTLREYAAAYADAYGSKEEISDLIPYMLTAFIESDAKFIKLSKAKEISRS